MSGSRHVGAWADTDADAVAAALAEVKVDPGEFITLRFSDSSRMEPIDPDRTWAVEIDTAWSEARQQYQTTLRKVPARDWEEGCF
jgi:hypothetical protein